MHGTKKSQILGKKARHLTLTTSTHPNVRNNPIRLYNDQRKLVQRIRRLTPLKLILMHYITLSDYRRYYPNKKLNEPLEYEYFRVRTNEGNGVLHIVQTGDFLPYHWIQDTWAYLHKSYIIAIREINSDNYGDRARYIVTQYVSNQDTSYIRSSMSRNYIYPGWRQDYDRIRNSVLHYSIKSADFTYDHWKYTWCTTAEHYAKALDVKPNQTRLSNICYPTDTQLIIQEWNKFLTDKFNPHNKKICHCPIYTQLKIDDKKIPTVDSDIANTYSSPITEDTDKCLNKIITDFTSESDKKFFPTCYSLNVKIIRHD